jgi:hypothetical protein
MGRLPSDSPTLGGNVSLDFEYKGLKVGYFMDLPSYPKGPDKYRYMPYRGPGHLRFWEDSQRSGAVRCTYGDSNGKVVFLARQTGEQGVIEIESFCDSDSS